MSKAYRPQRIGGSIYLCLPASFFSSKMLEKGVYVELVEKHEEEGFSIVKLREADGEYNSNTKTGGENSQESGTAIDIRKAGGLK